MNQYDSDPLTNEDVVIMQRIAIGLAAFVVLLLALTLGGCAEKEPLPITEEKIVGAWERKWLTLTNTYSFDGNGQALAFSIIPGQPVQLYAYKYWFNQDTLSLIDLSTSSPFRDTSRAVVSFPSEDTAILSWLSGVNYFLKRI